MRAADQLQIVQLVELVGHLGAEEPACAPRRHGPRFDIFWIAPHEIAEGSFMRHFYFSVDESDLINGADVGRETSVDAQHLAFNERRDAEIVEHLGAVLPWVRISVLADDLVIEAVDSGDLTTFVVASEKCYMSWVLDLQSHEVFEGFD